MQPETGTNNNGLVWYPHTRKDPETKVEHKEWIADEFCDQKFLQIHVIVNAFQY